MVKTSTHSCFSSRKLSVDATVKGRSRNANMQKGVNAPPQELAHERCGSLGTTQHRLVTLHGASYADQHTCSTQSTALEKCGACS
jgi:hypothetical protein